MSKCSFQWPQCENETLPTVDLGDGCFGARLYCQKHADEAIRLMKRINKEQEELKKFIIDLGIDEEIQKYSANWFGTKKYWTCAFFDGKYYEVTIKLKRK